MREFRFERDAWGTIAPGAVRVVAVWSGRPPVEAAIRGHYFAVRYLDKDGLQGEPTSLTLQAYDLAGHLLGHQTVRLDYPRGR